MESTFAIIAEPNRRAILRLLISSQQSVGEIERRLRMPQPAVSKHLRVLREAGFVESTVDAQRRLYRLKPRTDLVVTVGGRTIHDLATKSVRKAVRTLLEHGEQN